MAAAEHQLRLSRLGRADIGKHLAIDQDGHIKVKIDPAYTDTLREVVVEELCGNDGISTTRVRIKVADPVPALEALARVRGWERLESSEGKVNKVALDILGAATVEAFKAAYLKMIASSVPQDSTLTPRQSRARMADQRTPATTSGWRAAPG